MVEVMDYSPNMFKTVQSLLLSQNYVGFDAITPEGLPKCGFVARCDSGPIAVGFLRMVEGGYAQLDTLVSNAEMSSGLRHEGISMVVTELIERAKQLKLKGIIAFTEDHGVLARAAHLGFKLVPQTIISLPL